MTLYLTFLILNILFIFIYSVWRLVHPQETPCDPDREKAATGERKSPFFKSFYSLETGSKNTFQKKSSVLIRPSFKLLLINYYTINLI